MSISPEALRMVDQQMRARDITDRRVLAAMAAIPRHEFVPAEYRHEAYTDGPLPIGFGQTISQPYIVAWMTQELGVEPGARVFEVGTGCGYQTAVLAELGAVVYSVELVRELADQARQTLARLGYHQVHLRHGSGYDGWPEAAPFDRILLTAAPPEIPPILIDELADAGRLVAPVGTEFQVVIVVDKRDGKTTRRTSLPVRFVPML
jgi:protein-L-isoaspartate(D-aspartate) O-methyltransferase